jgi:hypothetical protein
MTQDAEYAMTMEQAARWWARRCGTVKPNRSTLIRWATRGCRGRRLRAELHGGRWYVTAHSLAEFHRHLNEAPAIAADRAAGPVRVAAIEENVRRLEAVLAGGDL